MSNGGTYDPKAVESDMYRLWEEGGHFRAEPNPDKRPYVIDIPLPNVTGALHLGHAIDQTLQDVLIRRHRMCGFETLWMPGTDHAGIATQAVVERNLKEEQNVTRHEIGRDGLEAKIWEWKEEYGGRILGQLRKMGFSCDWRRTRFTLDEVCAKAVYEVFFQWFKDGLIYRGERLVNWDAHLQTAVADDEVIYENVKSHFWHYRYPIEGHDAAGPDAKMGEDYLVIATTRPETMLGDTAVAVHPGDERYKQLIGKNCVLPLMDRPIPIIADGLLAKPELGTGCVKVTPGHDPNDYACGLRNSLPMINILTPDGRLNDNGGAYAGMSIEAARKKVVEDLEALGLMEKVEDYEHSVGHSDRSKTPIEPMLSEQWFMKMGELAESAMDAVRDGRVQFFPSRYAKTMLDWLGEKRDWCISRQLWWGHRIPVWSYPFVLHKEGDWDAVFFTGGLNHLIDGSHGYESVNDRNFLLRFVGTSDQTVIEESRVFLRPPSQDLLGSYVAQVCYIGDDPQVKQGLEAAGFKQDPDVLDTWFSSQLWPFSTLGWPHDPNPERERGAGGPDATSAAQGPVADASGSDVRLPTPADLDYFYPTTVLVTGRDIITLWVARMIISGLYFMKRVPFQHVYVHPNIQDGEGRRMSKSLGNGVDPLDIIELYGTDALRFTMVQMASETQDARLPVKPLTLDDGRTINTSERFEQGRNFCNKLWQAATGFVMTNLDGYTPKPLKAEDLTIEDRWILSRLGGCIAAVDECFASYHLNDVINTLYTFFWSDFCDWYIELVKPRLFGKDASGQVAPRTDESAATARQVLVHALDQVLRLMHPVVPFITEELWQKLAEKAPRRGVTDVRDAEQTLIIAAWPNAAAYMREPEVEREMEALQNVIRALRDTLARINTARAGAKTPAIGKIPKAVIRADEKIVAGLQSQLTVLQRLGRCEALEIGASAAKPPESAAQVLAGVEVYVPLSGLMDLAAERKRLQKERDNLQGHIERLTGKLGNEGFVSKAPPAVVERERERLGEMKGRLAALEKNLADISG